MTDERFTIASNQGSIAGGEVMLLSIAEAARDLGRAVTVVAPASPGETADEATRRGFDVVRIPGDTTGAYLRNLRRWDSSRQGLLWCNGLRPAFATAGHGDRIVELHQRPLGKLRLLSAVARRGTLATVVPSHAMADHLPGSIAMQNWNEPLPTRSRESTGDDPFIVGFLGRLTPDKGADVLCNSMRIVCGRHAGKFKLLLAGQSRFVDPVEARKVEAAASSLGDDITRPGWMDRREFFDAVDLAVFPSVRLEAFGLVASEAMSSRTPFIISDTPAFPEVAGADYPWIAPRGDAERLAQMIIDASRANWDAQLEHSYSRWTQRFSPGAGRERLAEILQLCEQGATT